MILSLVALAMASASPDSCRAGAVSKVIKDNDADEPFVLVTTAGAYRLAGQDFIHPRDWKAGDKLQICDQPGPGAWVEIKNIPRSEDMAAQVLQTPVAARIDQR